MLKIKLNFAKVYIRHTAPWCKVVKTNFKNVGIDLAEVNIFYSVEFLYQKVMVLAGIFSTRYLWSRG